MKYLIFVLLFFCSYSFSYDKSSDNPWLVDADKGDSFSQAMLAQTLYDEGKYNEAKKWFEKSANQNDAIGQYGLGMMYHRGVVEKDSQKAVKLFKLSADQGFPQAMLMLAILYEGGGIVDKDLHEAMKLYKKAADIGNPLGLYKVGTFYEKGFGVKQNRNLAKEYFGLACDKGAQVGCDEYKRLNQ